MTTVTIVNRRWYRATAIRWRAWRLLPGSARARVHGPGADRRHLLAALALLAAKGSPCMLAASEAR